MANLIRKRTSSIDPHSPWGDLLASAPRSLRRELDRLFDDFFASGTGSASSLAEFSPSLELTETKDGYLMRVELPGLSEKDVQVQIDDNNTLVIRGEKKRETQESRGGYAYSERSFGQFVRSVQLPNAVDAREIRASFENGVLQLDIPKTAEAHARSIPIAASGKGTSKAEASEQREQKPESRSDKTSPQPARH